MSDGISEARRGTYFKKEKYSLGKEIKKEKESKKLDEDSKEITEDQ
jgi:hypothetical protein